MSSVNLIKKSILGGILMGLPLLSQPAQAINWNFSYDVGGHSFTGTLISDGDSYTTNTVYTLTGIAGTVTDSEIDSSVSTVSSSFGADNLFVWNGTTGISLTSNGIGFLSLIGNRYRVFSSNGGSGSTIENFSAAILIMD